MLLGVEGHVVVFDCCVWGGFWVDLCLCHPWWVPGGAIAGSWGDDDCFLRTLPQFTAHLPCGGSSFSAASHSGPCQLHGSSHLGGCGVCPAGFGLRFLVGGLCVHPFLARCYLSVCGEMLF